MTVSSGKEVVSLIRSGIRTIVNLAALHAPVGKSLDALFVAERTSLRVSDNVHIVQNGGFTLLANSVAADSGGSGLDSVLSSTILVKNQISNITGTVGVGLSSNLVNSLVANTIVANSLGLHLIGHARIGQIQIVLVVRRESGGAQCQSHDHGQHSCNDLLHVCFLHKNLFASGSASSSETAFTT